MSNVKAQEGFTVSGGVASPGILSEGLVAFQRQGVFLKVVLRARITPACLSNHSGTKHLCGG